MLETPLRKCMQLPMPIACTANSEMVARARETCVSWPRGQMELLSRIDPFTGHLTLRARARHICIMSLAVKLHHHSDLVGGSNGRIDSTGLTRVWLGWPQPICRGQPSHAAASPACPTIWVMSLSLYKFIQGLGCSLVGCCFADSLSLV